MSFIDKLVQSKAYKNFMAKLYGWGAAVVIVGALFKINHWPGGTEMLIIGMGTETVIFFLSAFEPQHKEFDWSLVYPQLAGMDANPIEGNAKAEDQIVDAPAKRASDPLSSKLDQMLEDANISPELIDRLGQGMSNLANSASSLSDMASATASTDKFVNSLDGVAEAAGKLQMSMKDAPDAVNTLSNIYRETAQAMSGSDVNYADEMKRMSASLASINAMYEMQLKNSTNQIESAKEIQERMQSMTANFADTAEMVLKYKEQVNALSSKVAELNNVYGNMLAAMQTRI